MIDYVPRAVIYVRQQSIIILVLSFQIRTIISLILQQQQLYYNVLSHRLVYTSKY